MRDSASKGKVERAQGRYSAWTSDLYKCVQMHTHIHTLAHTDTCVHTHLCTLTCVCIYTPAHIPMHTPVHTLLCAHPCAYIHPPVHAIHMFMCKRACAHTHSCLCLLLLGCHSKFRANTSQVCADKIWLQLESPIQHPSKKKGGGVNLY